MHVSTLWSKQRSDKWQTVHLHLPKLGEVDQCRQDLFDSFWLCDGYSTQTTREQGQSWCEGLFTRRHDIGNREVVDSTGAHHHTPKIREAQLSTEAILAQAPVVFSYIAAFLIKNGRDSSCSSGLSIIMAPKVGCCKTIQPSSATKTHTWQKLTDLAIVIRTEVEKKLGIHIIHFADHFRLWPSNVFLCNWDTAEDVSLEWERCGKGSGAARHTFSPLSDHVHPHTRF